jgi:hypothetical protein
MFLELVFKIAQRLKNCQNLHREISIQTAYTDLKVSQKN